MQNGNCRRNEATRRIGRPAMSALAALTILSLVLPQAGAGGQKSNLNKTLITHSVWEVLATCQDSRWAKVNGVNKVRDYVCLKDGWGLIRKNNFVLACFFQLDAAYEWTFNATDCRHVSVPPKEPPTAEIQDLIVRAYERMALGAGMPPNIPKDPFGPDKKAPGPESH